MVNYVTNSHVMQPEDTELLCDFHLDEGSSTNRFGVPQATWYAWEAGRSLTLQQLPKIAKALGCKVRTLLPDE